VAGPKSKTVRTGSGGYKAVGLYFQGTPIEDYLKLHQIVHPGYEFKTMCNQVAEVRQHTFPVLSNLVDQVTRKYGACLRNVYFGTFLPGMAIKLHVNDNPHMYRAYLGLVVPQGDVGMRICHETLRWHEGEFMVLDHSFPHCPHNLTTFDRTVLVLDFFKPSISRGDALAYEKAQVQKRLKDSPYSLGVFGGSDAVGEEVFHQYGLAEQLAWDNPLQDGPFSS